MSYKDIEDIRRDFHNNVYAPKKTMPSVKKVKEGFIFDEEKSVKWNREEVERINKQYEEESKAITREWAEKSKQLRDDVVAYIMGTCGSITPKVAEIIEAFVYAEKHSYMDDYFNWIDDIADMVEDCIRAYTLGE